MQVDGFPSPRETRQKVYVLSSRHQRLPLNHKGLSVALVVRA
jgi:hypothetical protein